MQKRAGRSEQLLGKSRGQSALQNEFLHLARRGRRNGLSGSAALRGKKMHQFEGEPLVVKKKTAAGQGNGKAVRHPKTPRFF